ncbi:DNA sulfur modification protein DndB [Paenibacillus eucommiae]|uniref:DGQHR domain-containing protein n=1 Tax=Paenibacillus eucommiae TaxID=1355755 RepID=A0ABS4J0Y7_9BACL|nr:DNA sulfur modification protein DndB [Paenibacillus eucommiae]MBP1993503.1 DGQHR domain-containing protein [Paenibacillus eucommiae]
MDSISSLSELLAEQKPSSYVEVGGILGQTFGQTTLTATLSVSKLFSIYEVDMEVQRAIIPRNLSKLMDYINLYLEDRQPIYFPGIIFSARGAGYYDSASQVLRMQPIEKLYVVDGQHRLAAFKRIMEMLQSQMARAKDRREYERMDEITEKLSRLYAFPISTMIYMDINAQQERQLFSDINKLPRKIGGNLAVLRDQRRFYHVVASELAEKSHVMRSLTVDRFSERGKSAEYLFSYHLLIEILVALFEGRMKAGARNNGYQFDDQSVHEHVALAAQYFNGLLHHLPEPNKGDVVWSENIQIALALFFHEEATKTGKFNRYALEHALRILPHLDCNAIFAGDEQTRLPRRSRITKAYQFVKGFYQEQNVFLIRDKEDVG